MPQPAANASEPSESGEDAALCAGFLARRPLQELAFVATLRPLLHSEVRRHWPRLWPHLSDLEQSSLQRALLLRRDDPGRLVPPLAKLAAMLLDAPARALQQEHRRRAPAPVLEPSVPATQEEAFEVARLRALAASLPRGQASTLLCHMAHLTGQGPPLAEALGVDQLTADKRLVRAQAALYRRAYGADAEIASGETDDD